MEIAVTPQILELRKLFHNPCAARDCENLVIFRRAGALYCSSECQMRESNKRNAHRSYKYASYVHAHVHKTPMVKCQRCISKGRAPGYIGPG